jgi:hypothetical protein
MVNDEEDSKFKSFSVKHFSFSQFESFAHGRSHEPAAPQTTTGKNFTVTIDE